MEGDCVFRTQDLSQDPTEIKESGGRERNGQEGVWWEGRPSRSVFLLQILPSASPYLACPPGVLGRWAWMAVLGLLSSQPVPGTRRSSLAANQKSGEKGGITVSPEDGRGRSFLQHWLRASGDRLITIPPQGVGGRLPGGGDRLSRVPASNRHLH